MKDILPKIEKIAEEINDKLSKGNFKKLTDLPPPKQGIYIIKEDSNRLFKGKIFYVGKSTNLLNRIIRQHSSKKDNLANSQLRIKLNKKGMKYDKISDYLNNECSFIIQDINDYDINTIVEDLFIAILRKQGEPLLNHIKKCKETPKKTLSISF